MNLPADRVAVKICGVTRAEDAFAAVEAGADLLGFNTWPGTKRFVDLAEHAAWIAPLPVLKVALLVNATDAEVDRVAGFPFIDALQFHGDESADFCRRAALRGKPIIKARRASSSAALDGSDTFGTDHLLLDAHVPGAFGGTGARIDLELAREFRERFPRLQLWLAGGLRPENVADAVRAVRPRVVDVSSGVEGEIARKDAAKMRAFVDAVRSA